MKERLEQLRARVASLESKIEGRTRRIILIAAAGLVLFAIIIALLLNREKEYDILFSNLSTEEAQQIIGKLQESGTDYQYTNNGEILVPVKVLDITRANLALEGYPKNGFAYQTFIDNAGLMTTDSDKNRYALYDLQERMGATIELFSGVKSAEVTIALGETSKYVLSDANKEISTAHAVVTMADGGTLTPAEAQAVQRVVASGVPGLEMENVSVFDGNGNDVTVSPEEDTNTMTSSDADEIARLVEGQISDKVLHVLYPFFGEENVMVSVKAEINMETLIRETIIYNTPEKIDENDKTGILGHDTGTVEISGSKDAVASGVAGSETNADVPVYDTGDDEDGAEGYGARSWDRDFLVNQIKEQGQVSPGALDDLTISVALNSAGVGDLTVNDIRALVGNAAGIPDTEWVSKISVVSGTFYQSWPEEEEEEPSQGAWVVITSNPLFWIIFGIVFFLLILAVVLLVLSARKKKRKAAEAAAEAEAAAAAAAAAEQFSFDQEMIDFQNDRGMQLKQNLREFTEENPEIAAQMLKTWLNGGKSDGE